MPLTLTYTEHKIPENDVPKLGKHITDAFLKWHGLSGNKVMTPNVTMQLLPLPKSATLSGGELVEGVWLECKTPSFALAERDVQVGFFQEVTDLIFEAAQGSIPRNRIFTNLVHTVDGTWNLDGAALTNEQLGAAIAKG